MADRRLEFHQILKELMKPRRITLDDDQVYFQPPADVKMLYPAIVYKRQNIGTKMADDALYGDVTEYMLTVIDPDPDSDILREVLKLPMVRFNRHYTANNLNHDVFIIFY
jgi:hypothetical protein